MAARTTKAIKLFYCYAHEDKALRDELEVHLSTLKWQGYIENWHDYEIIAGSKWKQTIDTHLNAAQIILLLVSARFMASDYCYSIEMQHALERHKQGMARVIPLIMRAVHWEDAPFCHLQALPTDGKPVTSWTNQDEAFVNIVHGIRRAIEDIQSAPDMQNQGSGENMDEKKNNTNSHADPDLADYHRNRGDMLLNLKRYEEALAEYDKAIRLNPDKAATYHNLRGNIFHTELGRYEEAMAEYNKAIRLNPDEAVYYGNKGNSLHHLKRYEEAMAEYNKAIRLNPDGAVYHGNKGNSLNSLQRYEEALAECDEAIRLDPNMANYHNRRGNALYGLNHYEEAIAEYDEAIRLDPSMAVYHNNKGNTLKALQRYDEALAEYDEAIHLKSK